MINPMIAQVIIVKRNIKKNERNREIIIIIIIEDENENINIEIIINDNKK